MLTWVRSTEREQRRAGRAVVVWWEEQSSGLHTERITVTSELREEGHSVRTQHNEGAQPQQRQQRRAATRGNHSEAEQHSNAAEQQQSTPRQCLRRVSQIQRGTVQRRICCSQRERERRIDPAFRFANASAAAIETRALAPRVCCVLCCDRPSLVCAALELQRLRPHEEHSRGQRTAAKQIPRAGAAEA